MASITRFFSIAAVAMWLCGCSSEPATSDVKIMDYGLYQGVATIRPATQAGQETEVVSISVRNAPTATTNIPCKADTYFGFRLDPATLPDSCHLRLEYEHPAFSTKKGETLEVDEYDVTTREDFDGEIIYCFLDAAPHEMVPGTWTFRVLMDGKNVAEKSFEVVE